RPHREGPVPGVRVIVGRTPGAARAAPGPPGRVGARSVCDDGGPVLRDGGMVTAEAAVAPPGLFLVAFVQLRGLALLSGQLSCIDAARIGARAVARGETVEQAVAVAQDAAPDGAEVSISRGARHVLVTVRW